MKPKQLVASALITAGLIAGCADPKHPALNPHPKQRYEITLTIHDAPGPFESVTGFLSYDIENASDCAPQDWISGAHPTPSYHPPVIFHRVTGNLYHATVYLDTVQDGNYYGKGLCHWKFSGLSAKLKNRGVSFGSVLFPVHFDSQEPVTEYMPKRLYSDQEAQTKEMFFLTERISDDIASHIEDYFSTTLIAKESKNE